jgi:hypothetical protein
MAPERVAHVRLKAAAWALLRDGTRAKQLACEALTEGMTVEIGEDDDYEPDAIVRCGVRLADDAITVPDPLIVVEVLSPSTSAIDRSVKLERAGASGRNSIPGYRPGSRRPRTAEKRGAPERSSAPSPCLPLRSRPSRISPAGGRARRPYHVCRAECAQGDKSGGARRGGQTE